MFATSCEAGLPEMSWQDTTASTEVPVSWRITRRPVACPAWSSRSIRSEDASPAIAVEPAR